MHHNNIILWCFLIHFDLIGNVKQLAEAGELYPAVVLTTSV